MYQVHLANFNRSFEDNFATYEDAVAFAKSKGFMAIITRNGTIVGSWCPIGGSKRLDLETSALTLCLRTR